MVSRRRTKDDREAWERFGAALRLLRSSSGVGLRELARRLDVSATYVSRVEGGIEPPPSAERLVSIAHALGVAPDALEELAGRLAPDLLEWLRSRPDAVRLLRALMELGTPPEEVHALTRQVRSRSRDAGWLAACVGRAIAVPAEDGDPLEHLASALERVGADPERVLASLRARGLVTDASAARRVAIAHAEDSGLPGVTIALVRTRTRLVLGLGSPTRRATGRASALAGLARLASDRAAIAALEGADDRHLLRVLRRELRRVLGLSGHDGRGRPRAA